MTVLTFVCGARDAAWWRRFADSPTSNRRREERGVRARLAALVPGILLALFLGAGEASAQTAVCGDAPAPGQRIECTETAGSSADIRINARDLTISTMGDVGIFADNSGSGDIDIDLTNVKVSTTNARAVGADAESGEVALTVIGGSVTTTGGAGRGVAGYRNSGEGDIDIEIRNVVIRTSDANGVNGWQGRGAQGDIDIRVEGGSIETTGDSARGVYAQPGATGPGHASIDLNGVAVTTTGTYAYGAYILQGGGDNTGNADITLRGGTSIRTEGAYAWSVAAFQRVEGEIAVKVEAASIATEGAYAYGVYARHESDGGITLSLTDASLETKGPDALGALGWIAGAANEEAISIAVTGGTVRTAGASGYGVMGYHQGSGDIDIALSGSAVETKGDFARGVYGQHRGASGDLAVSMSDSAAVRTAGRSAHGVFAWLRAGTGDASVRLSGRPSIETIGSSAHGVWAYHQGDAGDLGITLSGGAVETEGLAARGLYGFHSGLGSVTVTTGEEAEIKAPFSIGVQARLTNNANAAGRVLVNHEGEIEARDAGVLAWATRMSGHSFGAGVESADDGARTEPMIHVASSGDVTVGADVMNDFIRDRVAGEDGALSAGEQAVLDAIAGNDAEGLEAALGALPEAYDDDWKAEARNLLRKRGWAPASASALAEVAADEILGIARLGVRVPAGIRVLVLDHHGYARYIRIGDLDPALNSLLTRTPEQQALFEAQAALSADERAVLEAVLLGGDLEAALARISPLYAAWKDEVRAFAKRYNAGDVRVDVTGGTITSGGDGVYARYVLTHERNGAVMVSVAEGAVVTGGRHGIYVSGAGAGEGNFRAQSVSIDGEVTGGTGAGVYLRGGGTLIIGSTGKVGAGVLAEGGGDLRASVAGRVEGDIRNAGGALTLTAEAGSVITGTVHEPVGAFTAAGSVGRLLYGDGGTVSVPATGVLTGVDGEAIRAGGDLSVVVAGMVTGDIRSMGDLTATVSGLVDGDIEGLGAGEHAVTVSRGGVVTGEIHLAASIVGADGTIGAARRDGGGMVAVGPTGVIRGMDGVAVRAGGAPLTVELALATRRLASVLGGAIVNEGGETTIIVNGVKLHDGAEGATGAEVPNGSRDVRLRAGAGADGVFALEEFIESHPPRAGIYEALPGLLLRLESGRARSARRTAPGSPVWVRLSGGGGSRGAERSTSGAEYDFDSFGAEAGLDVRLPWAEGLSGSVSVRHQQASADVSLPAGKGEIDLAGAGLAAALSWRGGSGWYLRGDFSVTDYAADLSSKKWGKLRRGAGAVVRSLDLEAGRRMTPDDRFSLAPRAWLARSEVSSMDSFTDSVGARFSLVKARRLTGGLGLLAEAERAAGGGTLLLRGSADLESVLSGGKTIVEVTGDRLRAEAGRTRLLLGVGARWRVGRFTMDGEISAAGLTSDDKAWGGRLDVGMRF